MDCQVVFKPDYSMTMTEENGVLGEWRIIDDLTIKIKYKYVDHKFKFNQNLTQATMLEPMLDPNSIIRLNNEPKSQLQLTGEKAGKGSILSLQEIRQKLTKMNLSGAETTLAGAGQ